MPEARSSSLDLDQRVPIEGHDNEQARGHRSAASSIRSRWCTGHGHIRSIVGVVVPIIGGNTIVHRAGTLNMSDN